MTIEKEARELFTGIEWALNGEYEGSEDAVVEVVAKALQAKQKRILELEEKVREYKWEWESACERERATNERVNELEQLRMKLISKNMDLSTKIKELESALKDLVTAVTFKDSTQVNGVDVYEARVPIEFVDLSKKAIGGGNEIT